MKYLTDQLHISLHFSKSDIALVLILVIGVFLRIWQLENTMIFFPDAGRDMLAAVEMIKTGEIPLLGIPSSVSRFKQGPLFVWFNALNFKLFGINPLVVGYVVAFFNSLALLACYALVNKRVNTTAAFITTFLLAVSPLAVAHSRMPYHITPIISFLLLYLWSLGRVMEKRPKSVLVSALAFALLFQFELALFPLILLIPLAIFRQRLFSTSSVIEFVSGLAVGLAPQIMFDLTHKFAQLGGFAMWLGYRFLSFFALGRSHAISGNKLSHAFNIFVHYFSRIFSLDHKTVGLVMFLVMLFSFFIIWKKSRNNFFAMQVVVGLLLLLSAFVVHGSPSEAYFPPIILLSCMTIGIGLSQMPKKLLIVSLVGILILAAFNSVEIIKNHFFSLPTESAFHYGPSYREQRQVMEYILSEVADQQYELKSTDPDSHFEAYLNNYEVIGLSLGYKGKEQPTRLKRLFFINQKESELLTFPEAKITFFPHVDVIEIPNRP